MIVTQSDTLQVSPYAMILQSRPRNSLSTMNIVPRMFSPRLTPRMVSSPTWSLS